MPKLTRRALTAIINQPNPGDPSQFLVRPTATNNLGVTSIMGCPANLIDLGDTVHAFAATYAVTPGQVIS